MKIKIISVMLCAGFIISACKKEEKIDTPAPPVVTRNDVPEFFKEAVADNWGKDLPTIKLIAGTGQKISIPQDLDFHPTRPNELWIINKGIESSGGTTVTITNPGESNQVVDHRQDGNAWHFMSLPSGIAFSPDNGNFCTTANVRDANHMGGIFTGPTLWSSDMSIYAKPSGGNGSHLDMLHETPFGMGVAAEKDNVFWVFDGFNKSLCRYDFAMDHGPGADYHGDGKIHRYTEVVLTRTAVPSHLVLDAAKKWIYIADGGTKRILRADITTGSKFRDLPVSGEPVGEYWEMRDIKWEVFADQNLELPCGIEIKDDRLFVSDYAKGELIAYNITTKKELARIPTGKPGLTGIKIGPDGKLWMLNEKENMLYKVEPK